MEVKTAKEEKEGGGSRPKYKRPPDQICANCGAIVPGSDLALISQRSQTRMFI